MDYDQGKLQKVAGSLDTMATLVIVFSGLGGLVFGAAVIGGTTKEGALFALAAGLGLGLGVLIGWLVAAPVRLLVHVALCLGRIEEHASQAAVVAVDAARREERRSGG